MESTNKERNVFINKNFILTVLTLTMLASCSPASQNVQCENWVIFSEQWAEEQHIGTWAIHSDQTIEYWTPSEEDVIAIEDGLVSYLEDNSENFYVRDIPVWERLNEYNRQYIGILVDGKRVVYANYFCDSVVDWKKDFVIVMDGGDCFFQFQYDADSGDYFDLQVNGSA